MRILITGTPGTGKSTIAKMLGKRLGYLTVNEGQFAKENGIGNTDKKSELVIHIKKLEREMNKLLKKEKDIIVEGHLLCEAKLGVDMVIVLRTEEKELEKRLGRKGYSDEKIMDNVFCEIIGYCKQKASENYGKKVIEIRNENNVKKTIAEILKMAGKKR